MNRLQQPLADGVFVAFVRHLEQRFVLEPVQQPAALERERDQNYPFALFGVILNAPPVSTVCTGMFAPCCTKFAFEAVVTNAGTLT
jgi:hypothetical protein